MTDFLLLHGGSHGAWCWKQCIVELERLGHRAVALDLPGHGLDSTPRRTVTSCSYVSAINNFLRQQPERKFTIVGHSLAGTIMPEIISANPGSCEEAVFIAAIVLNVGESTMDFIPDDRKPSYYAMAEASPEGCFLVSYETARNAFFNDLSDEDAKGFYAKLTPQPLAVYLEQAKVSIASCDIPRRYLVCKADRALGYEACLRFAERSGGEIVEIDCGHDVMLSQPRRLAQFLSRGNSAPLSSSE